MLIGLYTTELERELGESWTRLRLNVAGRRISGKNPEFIHIAWRHGIYRQALLQRYLSLRGC